MQRCDCCQEECSRLEDISSRVRVGALPERLCSVCAHLVASERRVSVFGRSLVANLPRAGSARRRRLVA